MKLYGVIVPKSSQTDIEDKGAVVMSLFNVLADEDSESEPVLSE